MPRVPWRRAPASPSPGRRAGPPGIRARGRRALTSPRARAPAPPDAYAPAPPCPRGPAAVPRGRRAVVPCRRASDTGHGGEGVRRSGSAGTARWTRPPGVFASRFLRARCRLAVVSARFDPALRVPGRGRPRPASPTGRASRSAPWVPAAGARAGREVSTRERLAEPCTRSCPARWSGLYLSAFGLPATPSRPLPGRTTRAPQTRGVRPFAGSAECPVHRLSPGRRRGLEHGHHRRQPP